MLINTNTSTSLKMLTPNIKKLTTKNQTKNIFVTIAVAAVKKFVGVYLKK